MTVADIDDYRPHLCLQVIGGGVHVIPVSLVEKWIAGELEPEPEVVRTIIQGWLIGVLPQQEEK